MSRLAHHVFFTLVDRSDQAIEALLAECKKYLDDHDGLIGFSVLVWCQKDPLNQVDQ